MFTRHLTIAVPFLAAAFTACSDPTTVVTRPTPASADAATASTSARDEHREYGPAIHLGQGVARTYVVLDATRRVPREIGIALSERAMEGLPAPMPMPAAGGSGANDHMNMNMFVLGLPQHNPTPYRTIELDWNPAGHEPAGVYDVPHFDFHFYVIDVADRNAILPTDPAFAQKAANLPAAEYRAQFYVDGGTLAHIPQAAATVPQMGLHWLDVRSPELQNLAGNPAGYKPFTKTFIYGSWNGKFIFDEPMITRAHIMSKRTATDPSVRDEVTPVSIPAHYSPAGYYPSAYRIMYDAREHEYRIALTQLAYRD